MAYKLQRPCSKSYLRFYRRSEGASAINCWRASCNSPAWYGLRLKSKAHLLPSIRSTNDEESQLSRPAMLAVEKIRCKKHNPSRFLQDQVGKASSLPVPNLWEDILLDDQDTLLSTPTPARHL